MLTKEKVRSQVAKTRTDNEKVKIEALENDENKPVEKVENNLL